MKLLNAFFKVSSLQEFIENATDEKLFKAIYLIFKRGTAEEIRIFAVRANAIDSEKLFSGLFRSDLHFDRFKEILEILLPFKEEDETHFWICSNAFVGILEVGGITLLKRFFKISGNLPAYIDLLNRITLDENLRPRIKRFKAELLEFIPKHMIPAMKHIYSPNELLAERQFFYPNVVEHFTMLLDNSKAIDKYLMEMVAFSRLWFNADKTIVNYDGEDFVERTLAASNHPDVEFCKCLYSSLTNRGRAILQFIFAEAEKIHPTFQVVENA